VLPRSITSGGVFVASAVDTFVVMPSHCWICTLTFAPVSFSNCSLIAAMVPSE